VTAEALYVPDGDRYVATEYTRGPWSREHQHAGPPSALMAREIERVAGIEGGQLTRMAVDILRPVPIAPLIVSARHLRPGRRVEQLEAVLATEDGTELMRATAWRMRVEQVGVPETDDPPPDGPDGLPVGERPRFFVDEIAYHASLEWRFVHGTFDGPGPAACWTRMRVALVEGETPSPLEHLLVMADAASGISAVLDWQRFAFMNVDFTVHLERPPQGEWLAMDAVTRPRSSGAGVCTSVLYDTRGRLGVTAQSLLVGPR
jgi:hypothetical protein